MDVSFLPTVNACLNLTAFIFLCLGWSAIKKGDQDKHRRMMITALIAVIMLKITNGFLNIIIKK